MNAIRSEVEEEAVGHLESLIAMVEEERAKMPVLEADAGPAELVEAMAAARKVVDRLEGLYAKAQKIALSARIVRRNATNDLEDAEMTAVQTLRHGEFVSARERVLKIKTECIEEVQADRRAERLELRVNAMLEIVRLRFRGAENDRRDLDSRLRALTLITSMERG